MDSHSFGDPVPIVDSTEDGTDEPSWTVDVIRISGNVVVGTLLISNSTLPPRKNKKNKIVWRLPDSIHGDLPRFGEQDKKRLWELFKEQKKKRRKFQNKINGKENEEDDESKTENIIEFEAATESVASSPLSNLLSPPPGFEDAASSATLSRLEHVSISSGLPVINTIATLSSYTDPRQHCFSVPVCDSTDAVVAMVGASVFDRFRQLVEGTDPVTTTNDEGSGLLLLNTWLQCYTEGATQSLLVGSAHTTAATPISRREQWCSVLFSSPLNQKHWTCRGWTAVPVVHAFAAPDVMMLMVLNGTTIQMETELLSFSLTLLLHGTRGSDEPIHRFAIVNAILTFQPTLAAPALSHL